MFTTRPEITGTFGVITTTHWIASAVGMAMLERGGNAFDAAVAAGFVLQVVQPHLVGPGGEVPIIFHSTRTGKTEVLCGQGTAPAGATAAHYRSEGMSMIPGDGLLATVIPGAFDAWMLLLRDHGTLELEDVLAPAIHYAESGHPLLPAVAQTIERLKPLFEAEWPTSAAFFCPNGRTPEKGKLFRNEALAGTWRRIVAEAKACSSRDARIEKARDAFYRGFVAEEIERFASATSVRDSSGECHRGVITAQDMAGWSAHYEPTLSYDYHDYTVHKTGPWGQGPTFLQALALLQHSDIGSLDPNGAEFVHLHTEAMKLAMADREVYYGDPAFTDVPIETLLSADYNSDRARQIGHSASQILNPGTIAGHEGRLADVNAMLRRLSHAAGDAPEVIEPTMAAMRAAGRGDTVHLDAIDAHGNMVAAMPSGGWFQSSPYIPALGFMLNSRAQMFRLEPGNPSSLEPGKRPRTTLTPSLAYRDGEPYMVFGTPGGDQQDQWQLQFFLRHVHHGLNLQEAIDVPMSFTAHAPSSFYPRQGKPAHLALENGFSAQTIDDLRSRGHDVEVVPQWTISSVIAASRDRDGLLRAAATPRLMQAYAIGR